MLSIIIYHFFIKKNIIKPIFSWTIKIKVKQECRVLECVLYDASNWENSRAEEIACNKINIGNYLA